MTPILEREIKFPYPIMQSDDLEGLPIFGFSRNGMFIHDPFLSDCGHFQVDPQKAHGLSQEQAQWLKDVNANIGQAARNAIDSLAVNVLQTLGLDWKEHLGKSMEKMEQDGSSLLASRIAANHIEHHLREEGVVFEDAAKPATSIKP
jgi:hypothetical protein